jgi:antitoxin component YwqK of YwqJK toxin-antitoxin module
MLNFMKTILRLIFGVSFLLVYSCGRTKDPDELFLSEVAFEKEGVYYNINCATHSNYKKYTGIDTCYYDNGKIKGTSIIKNGLPDGHWEQFNADGTKKLDLYFDNGDIIKKEPK